jgi:hypothetical protein
MSAMLLQVNFTFNLSRAEYEEAVGPLAEAFAALDGLVWKVWVMNEEDREAGGIYLFEDDASMQAYLQGPLAAGVLSHPALSDFSVKQFEVMEDVSEVTRGPV